MGWSLTYREPRDPDRLDAFFRVVGKSLYIANEFEAKCRYVLRLVNVVQQYEATGDFNAALTLVHAMKDKCLGPTLLALRSATSSETDLRILERAKDARNFIAHECALLGELSLIRQQDLTDQLARLRKEVEQLAAGDNVISRWVYEINEKEPAPKGIQLNYVEAVVLWTFDGAEETGV